LRRAIAALAVLLDGAARDAAGDGAAAALAAVEA
jgi:hypothetical protein